MRQAVPSQHPAVVLRSHFNQLRALLAVALIALIGLTVAVVSLATNEDQLSDTSSAAPIGGINYGGFNPATGRPESAPLPQHDHPLRSRLGTTASGTPITGSRYGGGPEEGTPGGGKDYRKNAATGDTGGDAPQGSLNGAGARTDYAAPAHPCTKHFPVSNYACTHQAYPNPEYPNHKPPRGN